VAKKEARAESGRRFQREGPIAEKDIDIAVVVLVRGTKSSRLSRERRGGRDEAYSYCLKNRYCNWCKRSHFSIATIRVRARVDFFHWVPNPSIEWTISRIQIRIRMSFAPYGKLHVLVSLTWDLVTWVGIWSFDLKCLITLILDPITVWRSVTWTMRSARHLNVEIYHQTVFLATTIDNMCHVSRVCILSQLQIVIIGESFIKRLLTDWLIDWFSR